MSRYRLKGTAGPVINQSFPLQGRLLIGTEDGCDIRVGQPGIARRHAEILLTETDRIVLRNLDDAHQTICNGQPVREQELASGDEIRVGQSRFLLQAPGLRPHRVLTEETTRPPRRHWPWLSVVALALAALLAWQRGWLGI